MGILALLRNEPPCKRAENREQRAEGESYEMKENFGRAII